MLKKELNAFFTSISPSETQKEKVLRAITEGEVKMKSKPMKPIAILIAAVLAIISGLTALAAATQWDEKLLTYFHLTAEEAELLSGAVAQPMATDTDNGVTVNVLQTVTDRQGIYVFFEVIAPEGTVLNTESNFTEAQVHYSRDAAQAHALAVVMATMESKVLEAEGNRMKMLLHSNCTGAIANGPASLHLKDLGEIECTLQPEWQLEYVDLTKEITVNQPVHFYEGNQNTLDKICVSPMSVFLYLSGDNVLNKEFDAVCPLLRYKDGTEIQLAALNDYNHFSAYYNTQGKNDAGLCTIGYRFDEITEISELESITVGDVTVAVE